MKYWLQSIILTMTLYSCGSHISTSNKHLQFVCLDSNSTLSQMKRYTLKIPNEWCSYLELHNLLAHSPQTLSNLKSEYYKNTLYVVAFDNDSYKSKNIEEALKNHIIRLNTNSQYNPAYIDEIHEIYGKYYIIKRLTKWEGENLINLVALLNYRNQDYLINYSVLEEDYDLYINEALQIISSFRIVE